MADVFRGPLLYGQRGRSPDREIGGIPPAGIPKTLTADALVPAGDVVFLAPQWPRRLGGIPPTGTPKTLTAGALLPIGRGAQFLAPQRPKRLGADTSLGFVLTLRTVVVAALPPGAQSTLAPPKWKWPQAEESVGTPKTLYEDDLIPVVNSYLEMSPIRPRRLGADTSADSPLTLLAPVVVASPIVNPPQFAADDRHWQVVDTSAGSALALLAPSVPPAPFFNPPWFMVDRWHWLPEETSRSLPLTFWPIIAPPFNTKPNFVIARRPAVTNTTRGVLPALYPPPPPPVAGVVSPSGDNKKLRAKLHRGRR